MIVVMQGMAMVLTMYWFCRLQTYTDVMREVMEMEGGTEDLQ